MSLSSCEESPTGAATPTLSAEEQSLVAELVADGMSIQEKFHPEPLYQQTGRGHYASETVAEIQRVKHSKRAGEKG